MTTSTIRRADADDIAAVESAAERFAARHNITPNYEGETWEVAVENAIELRDETDFHAKRLAKLWTACYCRALGRPTDNRLTIAYGYVGIRVA